MKQDRISEITRKAIEVPMEFTKSFMETTERVKTPSKRVNKIGRSIGVCAGVVLLLTGGAGLLFGKSSFTIGALTIGTVTILSNIICFGKNKKQK